MNKTPDALPAMAVTAAFAEGTTKLLNVPQARSKETDRIKCMAEELRKIDVDVEELEDGLIIQGGPIGAPLCAFHGRGDHRIVMALILAGMMVTKPYGQCTIIETHEAMSVTFPKYVELMHGLGRTIEPAGTAYAIYRLIQKFKKPTKQTLKNTTCPRLELNS